MENMLQHDNNMLIKDSSQEIESARIESSRIVNKANLLSDAIKDYKTLAEAASYLLDIKRQRKLWAEFNKPAKQKLDQLKSELLAREREIDEPMRRAEDEIIKPAIVRFEQEQEIIRQKEQKDKYREAIKSANELILQEAIEAEQSGDKELAEHIISSPVVVSPVVIPKMETPQGISYREVWKYRITDINKIPIEYMLVDELGIAKVVRALKNQTRINGVEVYCEKTIAGRTK